MWKDMKSDINFNILSIFPDAALKVIQKHIYCLSLKYAYLRRNNSNNLVYNLTVLFSLDADLQYQVT